MFDRKEYHRDYGKTHKEQLRRNEQRYRLKVRIEVLTHYGQGKLACAACGFHNERALTLDHCDNEGARERRSLGRTGTGHNFYAWLRRRGYPDGYITLCFNCQWIKEMDRRRTQKRNDYLKYKELDDKA